MLLLKIEKLILQDGDKNEVVLEVNSIPTFHDVMESYEKDFALGGKQQKSEQNIHFFTSSDRYLGSTEWIKVPYTVHLADNTHHNYYQHWIAIFTISVNL